MGIVRSMRFAGTPLDPFADDDEHLHGPLAEPGADVAAGHMEKAP